MRYDVLGTLAIVVAACGGTTPPPAPLVVQDHDASAIPVARSAEAGTPLPDAPSFEVATLKKCDARGADSDLKAVLASTTELAKKGPIADRPLVDALWSCFARFRPSQAGSSISIVRDLAGAVLAVKDPSYGPKAIEKISAKLRDSHDPAESMDQIQFWQVTSIRLLGELRYGPAARALVALVLDDAKKDLLYPTRAAVARIPKEAEPILIAALKGTDPELAQIATKSAESAYIARLADALAAIGRAPGRDAIIEALPRTTNDANRTLLAVSLPRFPASPRAQKAFLDAYAKVPANAAIALVGGSNGHAVFTAAAASFFDPALTEWLLKENAAAKGEAADMMPSAALPSAMRLMTPANAKNVAAAVNKIPGAAIEKEMYKAALAPLEVCKKDVPCYLRELAKPVPSSPPAAKMGHVKAVWMAAMYGDAATRAALVDRLAATQDGSVRVALVEAIAFLSPNGDAATADKLDAFVEAEKAAGNMSTLDEIALLALRLRARTL